MKRKGYFKSPQSPFQSSVKDVLDVHMSDIEVNYSADGKVVRIKRRYEFAYRHTAQQWADVVARILNGEGLSVKVHGEHQTWPYKAFIAIAREA